MEQCALEHRVGVVDLMGYAWRKNILPTDRQGYRVRYMFCRRVLGDVLTSQRRPPIVEIMDSTVTDDGEIFHPNANHGPGAMNAFVYVDDNVYVHQIIDPKEVTMVFVDVQIPATRGVLTSGRLLSAMKITALLVCFVATEALDIL